MGGCLHLPLPQPSPVPGTLQLWEIPSAASGFSYSANPLQGRRGRQCGPCPIGGLSLANMLPKDQGHVCSFTVRTKVPKAHLPLATPSWRKRENSIITFFGLSAASCVLPVRSWLHFPATLPAAHGSPLLTPDSTLPDSKTPKACLPPSQPASPIPYPSLFTGLS